MEGIEVARFGRAIGLKGEIKLYLLTDFPEQLGRDSELFWQGGKLTLKSFNPHSLQAKFDEVTTKEEAQRLTNHFLYTTKEVTLRDCALDDEEHFWFEIAGCEVVENGERLGVVSGIERIGAVDYLIVLTDSLIANELKVKRFMIPYISQYIVRADTKVKIVECIGARGILEAS